MTILYKVEMKTRSFEPKMIFVDFFHYGYDDENNSQSYLPELYISNQQNAHSIHLVPHPQSQPPNEKRL